MNIDDSKAHCGPNVGYCKVARVGVQRSPKKGCCLTNVIVAGGR